MDLVDGEDDPLAAVADLVWFLRDGCGDLDSCGLAGPLRRMPPLTAVARMAAAAPPEASKVLKTSAPTTALLPLSSRSRETLPAPRHATARQKAATTQAAATANRTPSSTPVAVAAAIATPSASGSALRSRPGGPDRPASKGDPDPPNREGDGLGPRPSRPGGRGEAGVM